MPSSPLNSVALMGDHIQEVHILRHALMRDQVMQCMRHYIFELTSTVLYLLCVTKPLSTRSTNIVLWMTFLYQLQRIGIMWATLVGIIWGPWPHQRACDMIYNDVAEAKNAFSPIIKLQIPPSESARVCIGNMSFRQDPRQGQERPSVAFM